MKTLRQRFLRPCLCIGVALAAHAPFAGAWDGTVSGKVVRVESIGSVGQAPGNYDFRVYIENQSVVCSGTADTSWGYVNVTDANYKGIMATILTAYTAGKTVTIFSNKNASGYCQIGYVSVFG